MSRFLWLLLLAFSTGGCSSLTLFGSTGTSSSSSDDDSGSTPDDDDLVDEPVPVSGAFLVCAAEHQTSAPITDNVYGCRLSSVNQKLSLPSTAQADISLYDQGGTLVASTTTTAAADSSWHWLVSTTVMKGPFTAELILRHVTVSAPPLVITTGTGSYIFDRATVEGSNIEFIPGGRTASLTALGAINGTSLPQQGELGFATSFPKYLKSNANKTAGSVLLGFKLSDADIRGCEYQAAADAPNYYVFAADSCKNVLLDVPLKMSLDTIISGATGWLVQLNGIDAPANVTAVLHEVKAP